MNIRAVIGIGSPNGEGSRGNIGLSVCDRLAEKHSCFKFQESQSVPGVEYVRYDGNQIVMVFKVKGAPDKIAETVSHIVNHFRIQRECLVIVHDDLDFPLGSIRIRDTGGDGGHDGLQAITKELKWDNIQRLRIGVHSHAGRGKKKKPEFLAEQFSVPELPSVIQAVANATVAIDSVFSQGLKSTQKKYHADQPPKAPISLPSNHPSKSPLMSPTPLDKPEAKSKIPFTVQQATVKKDFKITKLPKNEPQAKSTTSTSDAAKNHGDKIEKEFAEIKAKQILIERQSSAESSDDNPNQKSFTRV